MRSVCVLVTYLQSLFFSLDDSKRTYTIPIKQFQLPWEHQIGQLLLRPRRPLNISRIHGKVTTYAVYRTLVVLCIAKISPRSLPAGRSGSSLWHTFCLAASEVAEEEDARRAKDRPTPSSAPSTRAKTTAIITAATHGSKPNNKVEGVSTKFEILAKTFSELPVCICTLCTVRITCC